MTEDYSLERIELTDDSYTVEQGLIRNKFRALDADGNLVLRGKQKMLKLKEQFPFVDENDREVFEVNAGSMLDVAGDYTLTDAETDEELVILDNDYSLLQDTWTIRDADTEARLAEINSRGALTTMARNIVPFGGWIPHKYEITDADGDHVGTIDGQLSIRDRYEVTIDDASDVPTEPVVAAAMVIDAIQEN
ncbi:hypothetical protein B4589_002530 [Halolamina sp. CBA1230]|uniref:LURP-one-related/scramblase family protein n=1 Tax=Halolamina sp. CBA1230 TaxID=1853690 RepID=UPI0009A1C6A3|nr:hypothetical protein [Halolamina sp. CBA1230]QKY19305.1 hypothetical protein B4589_002530 [Halolamina sp. CBA1230]